MRGGSGDGRITEGEVEQRLEAAGRVLLALPWAGCFPSGYRRLWPMMEGEMAVRRKIPSSHEISAMDEAYCWTALIQDAEERRLVLMRSLVLEPTPFGTPRYVWSWTKLRRSTGLHPGTLQKMHARGLARIARGLNAPGSSGVKVRMPPPVERCLALV